MGNKDIGLKSYFKDATRYADLWNGGVFQGRQIVRADELQEITPVHSKSDESAVLERIGDLVMKQSYDGRRFAILALENQEKIDYGMPARILLQEALEYDRQIKEIRRENERNYREHYKIQNREDSSTVYRNDGEYLYKFRKEDRLLPVVTLVVYWGEGKWEGAESLHEMIDFGDTPEGKELKKLIPEYPMHFLDLSDFQHYEYFRTDLRPLLELFQRRNNKEKFAEYIRESEKIRNMNEESWYLLSQKTDSKSIRNLIKKREREEKEERGMCNALDELIADGKEEGKIEGRAVGKAEFIVDLLEEYGIVPENLKTTILMQTDLSVLKDWFRLAIHAKSVDEFIKQSHLTI